MGLFRFGSLYLPGGFFPFHCPIFIAQKFLHFRKQWMRLVRIFVILIFTQYKLHSLCWRGHWKNTKIRITKLGFTTNHKKTKLDGVEFLIKLSLLQSFFLQPDFLEKYVHQWLSWSPCKEEVFELQISKRSTVMPKSCHTTCQFY